MGAGGCGADLTRHRTSFSKSTGPEYGLPKRYTAKEVATHDRPDDSWIIIKDKVYDITEFSKIHPGGPVILTFAGRDATDVFSGFHAASTWSLLAPLAVGEFASDEELPEVIKDFRELRQRLIRSRLFESNKLYYLSKLLLNVTLFFSSFLLIFIHRSWLSALLSSALLGLAFQQIGWLAHDFLHHQVFKSRELNNLIGGVVLGNLFQGFSSSWWKEKHNKHHAVTNECDEKYQAVDPDIDTLPLLAWSKEMMQTVESTTLRSVLKWQGYFLLPMLFLARFAWLHSSLMYTFNTQMPWKKKLVEQGTLFAHFATLFTFAFALLPIPVALFWLTFSQVVGGLFLGIVFVQSHNGKEVYNQFKDFFTSQVISTRDVNGGLFNDWFTGGLNRQIEHHLFPTLPRHNLGIISKEVRALCRKHGLDFEDVSMVQGTRLVLQCLSEVATAA